MHALSRAPQDWLNQLQVVADEAGPLAAGNDQQASWRLGIPPTWIEVSTVDLPGEGEQALELGGHGVVLPLQQALAERYEDAPTENASLTIGNWPDSASWMPLVMHNQGRLKIRCATLNRMQRVALLM